MSDKFVYFDNINTTFPDDNVIASIEQVLRSKLGNPSAHIHAAGIGAARLLEDARAKVAGLISAKPESIVFTSGATEANNVAIGGFLRANPKHQLAVLSIEHFSIINQARKFKMAGRKTQLIDVDDTGLADLEQLEEYVKAGPTLVSLAFANPEIGTIQDVERIGRICRDYGAVFHCDATAALSTQKIDVDRMGIHLLTLSAHNIYGPTGVGALSIADGVSLMPLFEGGNQERGIRPGTENLAGAVGFGRACELAKAKRAAWCGKLSELSDRLWRGLSGSVPFIHPTGHPERRLPGHISFWIEHVEGESLLLLLNMKGVMAASGSACSSNLKGRDEEDLVASHVLSAVGVPTDICAGSLTFSLGKYNTLEEVDYVLEIMPGIVEKLLAMSPSYSDYMRKKESLHG
jgi:cysteine desulfurase